DARRQHARLAAAGAREDQRALMGQRNGFELLFVETGEKIHDRREVRADYKLNRTQRAGSTPRVRTDAFHRRSTPCHKEPYWPPGAPASPRALTCAATAGASRSLARLRTRPRYATPASLFAGRITAGYPAWRTVS